MAGDAELSPPRFEPLHPASRARLTLAIVLGPIVWLVAIGVVAVVVNRTYAIGIGLLVALVSLVVAAIGLLLLWKVRRRQESGAHSR